MQGDLDFIPFILVLHKGDLLLWKHWSKSFNLWLITY